MSNNYVVEFQNISWTWNSVSQLFHNEIDPNQSLYRVKYCVVSNGFSFTPKISM